MPHRLIGNGELLYYVMFYALRYSARIDYVHEKYRQQRLSLHRNLKSELLAVYHLFFLCCLNHAIVGIMVCTLVASLFPAVLKVGG